MCDHRRKTSTYQLKIFDFDENQIYNITINQEILMILHSLFPTPVACFSLDDSLTQKESDFINQQEVCVNQSNTVSVDTYLLQHEELSRIRNFCQTSAEKYFQEIYAPKYDIQLHITQSWSNYTSKGQWHHKHAHSNSIISGVFYVQAQQDVDKIYFYCNGYKQIKVPTETFNPYNSESWWMGTATGQLIIFPSSLTHMVQTVQTDETRRSISFNTFLKGNIGSEKSLTGLHL